MEKVYVEKDLCIACGSCVAMCPEHFEFDDDNLAKAINEEVNEEVKDAANACPTEAIKIEEKEEEEN